MNASEILSRCKDESSSSISPHYELFVCATLNYCKHLYNDIKEKLDIPELEKRYSNTLYYFEHYYDEVMNRLSRQKESFVRKICGASKKQGSVDTIGGVVMSENEIDGIDTRKGTIVEEFATVEEFTTVEGALEKIETADERNTVPIIRCTWNRKNTNFSEEGRCDVHHLYEFLLTAKLILACNDRVKQDQQKICVKVEENKHKYSNSAIEVFNLFGFPVNNVKRLNECIEHSEEYSDGDLLKENHHGDGMMRTLTDTVDENKRYDRLQIGGTDSTDAQFLFAAPEKKDVDVEKENDSSCESTRPTNISTENDEIGTEDENEKSDENESDETDESLESNDELYSVDEQRNLKYDMGVLVTFNENLLHSDGLETYKCQAHHHMSVKCLQTYFFRVNLKRCVSRLIEKLNEHPNLTEVKSEINFHTNVIKKCRRSFSLETCERLFKEFSTLYKERKRENPIIQGSRKAYFQKKNLKRESKRINVALNVRKRIVKHLRRMLKYIWKLDNIHIYKKCEKYVKRHIFNEEDTLYLGSRHPLLLCCYNIIKHYNLLVKDVDEKYKFIKYFDYSLDNILTECARIFECNMQGFCVYYEKMKLIGEGVQSNEGFLNRRLGILFRKKKVDNEVCMRRFEKAEFFKTLFFLKRGLQQQDICSIVRKGQNENEAIIEEEYKQKWLKKINYELENEEWKNVFEDMASNTDMDVYLHLFCPAEYPKESRVSAFCNENGKNSDASNYPQLSESSLLLSSSICSDLSDARGANGTYFSGVPAEGSDTSNGSGISDCSYGDVCYEETSLYKSPDMKKVKRNGKEEFRKVREFQEVRKEKSTHGLYENIRVSYWDDESNESVYEGDEHSFNEFDIEDVNCFENEGIEEEQLIEQFDKGVFCKADENLKAQSIRMFKYVLNHEIILKHILTETYRNQLKMIMKRFIKKLSCPITLNENYAEMYYHARTVESFFQLYSFGCCKEIFHLFRKKYDHENPLIEISRADYFEKMNVADEKKRNNKSREIRKIIKGFAESLYESLDRNLFEGATPKEINNYFVEAVMDERDAYFDLEHPHIKSLYNIIKKYNLLMECIKTYFRFIIYYDYEIDSFLRNHSNAMCRYMSAICQSYLYIEKKGKRTYLGKELIKVPIERYFVKRKYPEIYIKTDNNSQLVLSTLLLYESVLMKPNEELYQYYFIKELYFSEEEAEIYKEKLRRRVSIEIENQQLRSMELNLSFPNNEILNNSDFSIVGNKMKMEVMPIEMEMEQELGRKRAQSKCMGHRSINEERNCRKSKERTDELNSIGYYKRARNNEIFRRDNDSIIRTRKNDNISKERYMDVEKTGTEKNLVPNLVSNLNPNLVSDLDSYRDEEKKQQYTSESKEEKSTLRRSQRIIELTNNKTLSGTPNKSVSPYFKSYPSDSSIKKTRSRLKGSSKNSGEEKKEYNKNITYGLHNSNLHEDINDMQTEFADSNISPYEMSLMRSKIKRRSRGTTNPTIEKGRQRKSVKIEKRMELCYYENDDSAESVA